MDHLVVTLKELIKESMNMPADDIQLKGILEQLTILEEEIKEAIKSVEELMNKNSKIRALLGRLANSGRRITVRPIMDDCIVKIDPSNPNHCLIIDSYVILGGPLGWSKAFDEVPIDEVEGLLRKVLYIQLDDGRTFSSWEQLEASMDK
jgi:hypothetical protein